MMCKLSTRKCGHNYSASYLTLWIYVKSVWHDMSCGIGFAVCQFQLAAGTCSMLCQ